MECLIVICCDALQITGVVQATVNSMVGPAWKQIQSSSETLGAKIEPVIRAGAEPIYKLKKEAKDKIRGRALEH